MRIAKKCMINPPYTFSLSHSHTHTHTHIYIYIYYKKRLFPG